MMSWAWMLAVAVMSLIGCGPAKPSEEDCDTLRSHLHHLGGTAGRAQYECADRLTKTEVTCLNQKGWLKITDCPGFSKLEIDKDLFKEVYCVSITTEDSAKHECAYPWVNCETLRRNELREGGGKQISTCKMATAPYAINYICRDGSRCARYFANKNECRKWTSFMMATENNVSDCTPE